MSAERYLRLVETSMGKLPRFMIPLPDGESPYLERFVLDVRPDGSKTYLHVIYESDGDRDPHCHPWDWKSKILFGEYQEELFARHCPECDCHFLGEEMSCWTCPAAKLGAEMYRTTVFKAGETNVKQAHQLHRLTLLTPVVVTLVERGPKVREWGFQTPEGWEHHSSYIARKFPNAQPTEID